jgi:hypothetical protein
MEFQGPVFLVGMPRSGTKLLRELLNNHSRIGITPNESHFIPDFHARWARYGDIRDEVSFHRFYQDFAGTIFFQRVMEEGRFLDEQKWKQGILEWTYPGVVEAFYRLYAESKGKTIWGDKTPYYLLILPELKSLFPGAKFVHIVRDVRDYVISLNKDWSKNIYRSAQRWNDAVARCRRDGTRVCPADYHEVRYERLSDDPEGTLKGICSFLSLSYENSMVVLRKPADQRTDAGGKLTVQKKNYGKWEQALKPHQVRKIERLCGDLLSDLGYQVSYTGQSARISPLMMKVYQLRDAAGLYRFEVGANGLLEGSRNMVRTLRYARYRTAPGEED